MRFHPLILLGVFWLGAFIQPEKEILEKIISAPKYVEFHGVWQKSFRYRDQWFETQQEIWHQRPDRTKILFQEPEEVRGTVLLKEGGRVIFRRHGQSKQTRGFRHSRHYTGGFFGEDVNARRLDLLLRNYVVSFGDTIPLLGRSAVEVRIVPRSKHRSRLVLWVDQESGLVLKMKKYDPDGNLVSRAEFKKLAFRLPEDSNLEVGADSSISPADSRQVAVYPDLESFRAKSRFAFYLPGRLPQGFVLDRIRTIRKKDRETYHFLYTDGLSWVSLFQRARKTGERTRRAAADTVERRGPMLVLHGQVGNVSYALVGEVAADELEAMRASLRPVTSEVSKKASTGRLVLMWGPVIVLLALFLILRLKREAKHVGAE